MTFRRSSSSTSRISSTTWSSRVTCVWPRRRASACRRWCMTSNPVVPLPPWGGRGNWYAASAPMPTPQPHKEIPMAVKKRGLGRGLDALLGGTSVNALQEEAAQVDSRELQYVHLDLIQRGKYQPRRDMDATALDELAQSIKAQGVRQPIVLRPIGQGRYEIVAGERRWRACQQAGLDKIPAMVRELPDEAANALGL